MARMKVTAVTTNRDEGLILDVDVMAQSSDAILFQQRVILAWPEVRGKSDVEILRLAAQTLRAKVPDRELARDTAYTSLILKTVNI